MRRNSRAKHRVALINTGAAPGLTNFLVKRAADLLDEVQSVHIRLYESTESEDPISQWSPEVSFRRSNFQPPVYRHGKVHCWRSVSLNWKNSASRIRSERPMSCWQRKMKWPLCPKFIPMQEPRRKNRRQRIRPPAPLAQTGQAVEIKRTAAAAFPGDVVAAKNRRADPARVAAERALCRLRVGARRKSWSKGR